MSPDDRMKEAFKAVQAEIRRDLETLRHVVTQIQAIKPAATPSAAELAFFALNIDRAYSACEAVMVRIARHFDGITPQGPAWHTSLLHQMCLPIQEIRPAVLRLETANQIEKLLHFRHFLRHSYHVDLDWVHIQPLVSLLPDAANAFCDDLDRACLSLFA